MKKDPQVFIFGLGVDDWKGIFGTTREATKVFGGKRVFDTPASEGALTGVAIGAALCGKRPVLVHARNDFMFLALDQMVNMAAKWKYVYANRSHVPIVVRGIIGKGWGQGSTHSQSLQSFFAHIPGLYVAMPSCAYTAKGLFLKSLTLDVPVVILEHRALYDIVAEVPEDPYEVEFGKANVLRKGSDITIVATSLMVVEALKAADRLKKENISVEVIDPVSLRPLDEGTILRSVEKTGRLIAADLGWMRCGFASEVVALVAEKGFTLLKAPAKRITWPECPSPVSKVLEDVFYPSYRTIITEICGLMNRGVPDLSDMKDIDTFKGPY